MLSIKGTLLLIVLATAHAATFQDKRPFPLKRAADTYAYPSPIVTFQENPKKTVVAVETIKSVPTTNSGGRYLPPNPSAPSAPKSPPISVSFSGYDAPAPSKPSTTAASAPSASPTVETAAPSAGTAPSTNTVVKKRPSGGLGGFAYYGGSGSSSSSKSDNVEASVPAAPVQTVKVVPAPEKPIQKAGGKIAGYDYPSPKPNRKPTKKEQKLADSKPEESAQGYHYDVGPEAFAAAGALAGGVQTFSSGGSSGGMMGLSYMRQSSPFYSYHVMLD